MTSVFRSCMGADHRRIAEGCEPGMVVEHADTFRRTEIFFADRLHRAMRPAGLGAAIENALRMAVLADDQRRIGGELADIFVIGGEAALQRRDAVPGPAIARRSGGERVWQSVYISIVPIYIKKKHNDET